MQIRGLWFDKLTNLPPAIEMFDPVGVILFFFLLEMQSAYQALMCGHNLAASQCSIS